MTDYLKALLPRFRYGVIQPRAHEDVSRARSYQLYKLLPLDFIEISTGLGLENYTEEGVEKAIRQLLDLHRSASQGESRSDHFQRRADLRDA